MSNEENNQGHFQTIVGKLQTLFSSEKEDTFAFTEENLLEFVKEEDGLLCINFAMGENFLEKLFKNQFHPLI